MEISKGGRTLEASALTLDVDEQMRPRQVIAGGRVTVRIAQGIRNGSFEADQVEIGFDSQGRAKQIDAGGNVVANQAAPAAMRLAAKRLLVALDPLNQQPRTVDATGDVRLSSTSEGSSERLVTSVLRLTAMPVAMGSRPKLREGSWARAGAKAEEVRLDRATSGGPATVVWQSKMQSLRLDAKRRVAESAGETPPPGRGGVHRAGDLEVGRQPRHGQGELELEPAAVLAVCAANPGLGGGYAAGPQLGEEPQPPSWVGIPRRALPGARAGHGRPVPP